MSITITRHLYVNESGGEANYNVWKWDDMSETHPEYHYLGKIELPAVSDELLRDLAMNNVNAEIAKARLVLDALNDKKQQLLALPNGVE